MSVTKLRYTQVDPTSAVALNESKSRGLNNTSVIGLPTSFTLSSVNSGTRIASFVSPINEVSQFLVPGYLVKFNGTTPVDNAYYTLQTAISDTQVQVVETPPASLTGGTVSFYYPSGASIVGVDNTGYVALSGVTQTQQALNILDDRAVRIYTSGGLQSNLKVWTGRQQSTASSTVTFDISSAGFSTIISIQATAERNTSTLGDVPLANVRSYTTSSVVVQLVESTGIILGGQGLEFSASTSNFVHLLVIGT